MFAAVVVNQKANALNRIFYYTVPADMQLSTGMVVEVSFAHRSLEAVVVELTDNPDDLDFDLNKLKPIERIVHPQPLFHPDLLALSKYLADYYLVSWVAVLQAMLPAGMHLTGKMPKAALRRCLYPLITELPPLRGQNRLSVWNMSWLIPAYR